MKIKLRQMLLLRDLLLLRLGVEPLRVLVNCCGAGSLSLGRSFATAAAARLVTSMCPFQNDARGHVAGYVTSSARAAFDALN